MKTFLWFENLKTGMFQLKGNLTIDFYKQSSTSERELDRVPVRVLNVFGRRKTCLAHSFYMSTL